MLNKRWNGWGRPQFDYPLPRSAAAYLQEKLGNLTPLQDASLESILKTVPKSKLPPQTGINREAEVRVRHARGQSLPDWISLNYGTVAAFPDGVAYPEREEDVSELLRFAAETGAKVIPYGGGTSVVGHINPTLGDQPTLTVAMEKMDRLIDFDPVSHLAEFQAGISGPALEGRLAEYGCTMGHFPQSFEFSTLGGWIATRSSGQQSYHYGRIEDIFVGGGIETPRGHLEIPVFPASAAGPDLRELLLGSEGRLGIITRATVRVHQLPQQEDFYGVFFPCWENGAAAVREIAQRGIPVSMLRLSDPQETETTLILSGKSWIGLADRGLRTIGLGDQRCLLIFGVTGTSGLASFAHRQAVRICREQKGLAAGTLVGRSWEKSRFTSPYLRNTLWAEGIAVDTLETALPWLRVSDASRTIPESIRRAAREVGEKVLVLTHLSHIYPDGASIYITYLFRRHQDPDHLLQIWQEMKTAASLEIQQFGGTITHQHGIGLDHKSYLAAEKGNLGLEAIRGACQSFDPGGMLNPGKLFD